MTTEAEKPIVLPGTLKEMERLFIGWFLDHGYEFEADAGSGSGKHRITVWPQRRADKEAKP